MKQDADILFVLTTNRPEQLEGALQTRPGRIDQAIEVPLPDEIGRNKLIQLYGSGLPLGDAVVGEAARRTKGVSAAFIKELMRRMARERCRVKRFWPGAKDEVGRLVHRRGGAWAFDYNPQRTEDDEPGFRFDRHSFVPGGSVSITEHDGTMRTFRVMWVQDLD